MQKYKIAFVCVHNSCRSQMAEGWAKALGSDILEVYSAGTEEYNEVKPLAIEVMTESGIDMSRQYPKRLDEIPNDLDLLITMGCNVQCPFVPNRYSADWGIDDPSGGPIEDYREARDMIKQKVLQLIDDLSHQRIVFEH